VRHAGAWVVRLGQGTAESHTRAQAALERIAPYLDEMFDPEDASLAGIAPDVAALRAPWDEAVGGLLREAGLAMPDVAYPQRGGRAGRHGEALGHLLAEFQHLHRSHPGAQW
jgi:ring-1,2-phenylacetyl-CoA epoxidase subunit PaaC